MADTDTDTDTTAAGAALVPGAHRSIRRIDAGEGPYAGTLVTRGAAVAVRVDAATISGWAGWEHAGDDHVAGPLDIVRRSDGHDVLLPWCTERVSSFLGRRSAAGVELASGETTTLVASILRGLGELGRSPGDEPAGEWWLTDDGRPTFVIGQGGAARAGAADLVSRMREDCEDRALSRLLVTIDDGLKADTARQRVPGRQLERWEAQLFETSAPKPLRRDVHAPERARDADAAGRAVIARPDTQRLVRSRAALRRDSDRGRAHASRILGWIARRLARWCAAVVPVLEFRRRRAAERGAAHRDDRMRRGAAEDARTPVRRVRRTIVAGAAAAVVIAGGLLWPGGATGEPDGGSATSVPESARGVEEADRTSAGPSPEAVATAPDPTPASPPEGPTPDGREPADPVEAARRLIDAIGICGENGDPEWGEAVARGSVGAVDALVSAGEVSQLELVDEYGDVAVIRASSSGGGGDGATTAGGERMVVLVRVEEKWLVRDVYDVADQPG